MGVYISRRCPHCNKLLELEHGNNQYFGNPLIKCPKCNGNIVLSSVTEWELLSNWDKFKLLFSTFSWGVAVIIAGSFFGSFMSILIILEIFKTNINETYWSKPVIVTLGIVISLVWIFFRIKNVIQSIKESKERTKDKDYFRYVKSLKRGIS